MEPNASPVSISSIEEKYSAASTPPTSVSDNDENEEVRLDLEHLDDLELPSAMSIQPLIAIPEPTPFFPKQKEEVKTDEKSNAGRLDNFDKSDSIFDGAKEAKDLTFHGSTTWSMGYFLKLSSGRGDIWRERSIWHSSDSANNMGGMQAKKNDATKLNETGGHSCGVLFWGW